MTKFQSVCLGIFCGSMLSLILTAAGVPRLPVAIAAAIIAVIGTVLLVRALRSQGSK